MYRKIGPDQNLGEEEKITSKFLSTFGFISVQNPVHKTFMCVSWSKCSIRQSKYHITVGFQLMGDQLIGLFSNIQGHPTYGPPAH